MSAPYERLLSTGRFSRREARLVIRQAIANLDGRQAEAMMLFHLEGVTNKAELARRLGIKYAPACRLLERAEPNFKAELETILNTHLRENA